MKKDFLVPSNQISKITVRIIHHHIYNRLNEQYTQMRVFLTILKFEILPVNNVIKHISCFHAFSFILCNQEEEYGLRTLEICQTTSFMKCQEEKQSIVALALGCWHKRRWPLFQVLIFSCCSSSAVIKIPEGVVVGFQISALASK